MSLRNQIHKLNEVDESLQRLVRLKSQVLQHLFSDYSETVNRAKSNFAPATSSGVYSCRFSNRGSPLTPITTRRSPVTRATLGAFCGISTLTPKRDCITSIVALWLGLRQLSTPPPMMSLACSTLSSCFVIMQFAGNIDGAIPKPKYVFFMVVFSEQVV